MADKHDKQLTPNPPPVVEPPDTIREHPFELRHEVKRLNERLDQLTAALDKAEIQDIIENYSSVKRRILTNFIAGAARGLGLSLGTLVILALLGYLLSLLVSFNLPVIGDYISELLKYVNTSQSGR
ncbi:DUF5665 domain-containing protein [Paenibacillus campi]|uniref:DUF5665 domain-containing protein n=1 Tax=Paenibacillus campi TaxID=3106031 RepID=UPI002AFF57E3|nr:MULTISPECIES: DUF5665 domain-containing protein [unclassified Paenibacillus]